MQDTRDKAYPILAAIADTYYQYPSVLVDCASNNQPVPQSFFPAISYFDSDHREDAYADGKGNVDVVEYTVDCWEKQDESGNLKEIHFDVATAMKNAGYIRTMYVSQFEEDTKVYHYSMKFIKQEEDI